MQDQEIFNGLIATYRDLNLRVRPLPEERLRLGQGQGTVRNVIKDMRDDELRFSQALKDRLAGGPMTDVLTAMSASDEAEEGVHRAVINGDVMTRRPDVGVEGDKRPNPAECAPPASVADAIDQPLAMVINNARIGENSGAAAV